MKRQYAILLTEDSTAGKWFAELGIIKGQALSAGGAVEDLFDRIAEAEANWNDPETKAERQWEREQDR